MSWRSQFHVEEIGELGSYILPPDKIAVGDVKGLIRALRVSCHPTGLMRQLLHDRRLNPLDPTLVPFFLRSICSKDHAHGWCAFASTAKV
jgi:hypothetical protein